MGNPETIEKGIPIEEFEEQKENLLENRKIQEFMQKCEGKGIKFRELFEKAENFLPGMKKYLLLDFSVAEDYIAEIERSSPEEIEGSREEIEQVIALLDSEEMKQVRDKYKDSPVIFEIVKTSLGYQPAEIKKLLEPRAFSILSQVEKPNPASSLLFNLLAERKTPGAIKEIEDFLNYLEKDGRTLLELSNRLNSGAFLREMRSLFLHLYYSFHKESEKKELICEKEGQIQRLTKLANNKQAEVLFEKYTEESDHEVISRLLFDMSDREDLVDGAKVLLKLPKLPRADLCDLSDIYSEGNKEKVHLNNFFSEEGDFREKLKRASIYVELKRRGLKLTLSSSENEWWSRFVQLFDKYGEDFPYLTPLLINMSDREDLVDGAEFLLKLPKLDTKDLSRLREIYLHGSGEKVYLNNFFSEEGDFREKLKRADLYLNLEKYGLQSEPPSLSKEWWDDTVGKVNEGVKRRYGTERDVEIDEAVALLEISQTPEELKEIIETKEEILANKAKHYPLNKEYTTIGVTGLKEKVDPVKATEALIYGLISPLMRKVKDKESGKEEMKMRTEPLRKALSYFEKEKLKKARNYIKGFGPQKIYSKLKSEIETIRTKPESVEGLKATEKIREFFKKEICEKGAREKVEPLSDLIASIENLEKAETDFDYLIFKTQNGKLTDLFDNRTIKCCAFYPDGANKGASVDYFRDEYIGLLQAKTASKYGKELREFETAGVAIAVLCKDEEGKKVLLIDSVEGGVNLERVAEKKWQEAFKKAIQELAQDTKVDYLLFNNKVANFVPESFNEYLEANGLESKTIQLEKLGDITKEYYLEFFGGWSKPQGKGEGFVVEIKK